MVDSFQYVFVLVFFVFTQLELKIISIIIIIITQLELKFLARTLAGPMLLSAARAQATRRHLGFKSHTLRLCPDPVDLSRSSKTAMSYSRALVSRSLASPPFFFFLRSVSSQPGSP
mmetsp:Transcript_64663/g.145868  ORF Transcript_64663/g.145868 Transcript_64663/m.145868 type:complete len:116 (+) Transcript_64663:270-617(+)